MRASALQTLLAMTTVFGTLAACGGDNGPRLEPTSAPQANASADEQYARQMCTAIGTLAASLQKAVRDNAALLQAGTATTDADRVLVLAKVLREPIAQLVAEEQRISPPADLGGYHQDAIAQGTRFLAALDQGDRAKLNEILQSPDALLPSIPSAAGERLAKASANVEACKGLGVTLGQ